MSEHNGDFIQFCIRGLQHMYLPQAHAFSASYRDVNGSMHNIRHPGLEYKYSMNTFMGLHKAAAAGYDLPFDIEADFNMLAQNVTAGYVTAEDVAATVWAAGAMGLKTPPAALAALRAVVSDESLLNSATAQTMAWLVFATLAAGDAYLRDGHRLVQRLCERYLHDRSHLVRHTPAGLRSDWASFAASCYTAYVLLCFGNACNDEQIRARGVRIARKLVSLQGAQGQWAWFYYVPDGVVADYYQVYSVHQEAMAPLFLLAAIDQGYDEFRAPLTRGFDWILGRNEFTQSMVSTEHSLVWRSAVRNGPMEKGIRFARGLAAKYAGYRSQPIPGEALHLNRECRSYELGWALWAFAGRDDFDLLLKHVAFRK